MITHIKSHKYPDLWQEELSSSCRAGQVEGSWDLPWVRKEKLQRQGREGGNKNLGVVLILPRVESMAELLAAALGWGKCSGESWGWLSKGTTWKNKPCIISGFELQTNIQGFMAKVGFAPTPSWKLQQRQIFKVHRIGPQGEAATAWLSCF